MPVCSCPIVLRARPSKSGRGSGQLAYIHRVVAAECKNFALRSGSHAATRTAIHRFSTPKEKSNTRGSKRKPKATCAFAVQGSRVMRVQVHGSWFAVHGSRFTQLQLPYTEGYDTGLLGVRDFRISVISN